MSRPDKAVEPSMDEILASIRKIISEEPIGTRPGPAGERPSEDSLGRYEPGADPALAAPSLASAQRRLQSSDAVGIDDVLDLAQGTAAGHATGPMGDKGGTLAKPASTEPRFSPAASNGAGAVPTRDGEPESTKSIFPPLKPDLNGHGGHGGHDGHGGTNEFGGAAPRQAASGPRPGVDADAALSEARAKIERHLGTPPKADSADRPLMLGLKSIRDAGFRGVKPRSEAESAGKPGAGGLMARVAAASPETQPSTTNDSIAPVQAQAGSSGVLKGGADPFPSSKGAAQKTADSPAVPTPETGKTPDAAANATSSEKGQATPVQDEGKPAQSAPAAAGKTAAPAAVANAVAPAGERARAFENAVAEMLRPMLREWLDANLPRLVQQALREEMARSSLPGKDNPAT